jgi:zinc protease
VIRAKTAMLSGYAGLSSSPDAVLAAISSGCSIRTIRAGAFRRATIEATTPASFRKLWEPLLASGPIEVEVFGDMDSEATVKAVAETFGAMKPRPAGTEPPPPVKFPAHVDKPVVRTHTGKPEQAAQ